ncbi:MAG: TadE/TadG family type IV pilus assembly protein [Candidatus Dormiibacterota bacterium]
MRLRDTRRGQAMVEMAMLLPVLLLLFLGAWTAANLIDDNNSAAQATRAGARLAAELGNAGWPNNTTTGCQASKADPCQVDKDIIDQVLPIVSPQLTNAKVIEIDIYQPNGCIGITPFSAGTCPPNNGAYCTPAFVNSYTPVCAGVTELIDAYTVNGLVATLSGSENFPLSSRGQSHPAEAELGVRLVFTYTSPTLSFFTQTDTQYTVMRLAPTS